MIRKVLTYRILPQLLLVLLATALFPTGCKKVEQSDSSKVPLVFCAAADELDSKAVVHTAMMGRYDENERFAVYAAFAENSFDKDDPSTYVRFWYPDVDDPIECKYYPTYYAWAPEALYYWPLIGTLTFQAYSPADLGSNATTPSHNWASGFTFTNFQIPGVGEQYDLMYSERVENCRRSDYTSNAQGYDNDNEATGHPYYGIDIDFKHALCQVEVQALSSLGSNSSVKFRVKNVCLVNAYDTGDFSQAGENWAINTGHTASYNLLGTDVWKGPLPGANDYETEFPVAPALILLPQVLNRDAGHEVAISLTYEKYEGDTVLGGDTIIQPLPLTYTEEGPGGTSVVTTGWQRAKKYTYRFIFSDYIEFEAKISLWKDATRGHYLIVQ